MRVFFVILAASVGVGCAGAARYAPQTTDAAVREEVEPRKLVDARTGESVSLDELLAELRTRRVVYVGERHDRATDHNAQNAILRGLYRDEPSLGIGMEMFQVPFQEALDRWSAGQIDETVLRRDTEYDDRWGYDFSLYRPMLEFARSQGLAVIALNAPREVAHAVAMTGVEALDPELAGSLPELDLDDEAHRALFDEAFDVEEHGVSEEMVDRFYQAQVVWDETMGSRVAETLARDDGPAKLIVFAGRIHVHGGLGIPDRAARRGAAPYVVVLPVDESELAEQLDKPSDERAADFFWVSGR